MGNEERLVIVVVEAVQIFKRIQALVGQQTSHVEGQSDKAPHTDRVSRIVSTVAPAIEQGSPKSVLANATLSFW